MRRQSAVPTPKRRGAVVAPMSTSQFGAICSICTLEFEPGNKVMVFACHNTHMLHINCYVELKKYAEKKKSELACPICRKPVDKKMMVKKKLLEAEAHVEVYDPFIIKDKIPLSGSPKTNKLEFPN